MQHEKLLQVHPSLFGAKLTLNLSADAWKSRWIESKHKSDYGQLVLTAGKFYGDGEKDKGERGTLWS